METKDIVTDLMTYKDKHWVTERNNGNDFTPLMPYMLLNVGFQIMTKHIPKKIKGNQEANKIRGMWKNEYDKYTREFLTAFPQGMKKEWIDDRADEIEEYLNNDLVIAKVTLMDCFKSEPLEVQDVVASALLYKALAVCAQTIHGLVYKTKPTYAKMSVGNTPYYYPSYQDEICIPIRNIIHWVEKWIDAYYLGKEVNLSTKEKVDTAINVLCRRIASFNKLKNGNNT